MLIEENSSSYEFPSDIRWINWKIDTDRYSIYGNMDVSSSSNLTKGKFLNLLLLISE